MNDPIRELERLRWPLLWLLIALLFALSIGGMARYFAQQASSKAAAAELAAARMRADTQKLRSEEPDIRAKIIAYQAIAARGLIGPEQRLGWDDLIRTIEHDRQLYDIDYEIQPQKLMSGLNMSNSGYLLLNSQMRIKLSLLHEGDLLRLIADLQANAPALIRTNSCRLTRRPVGLTVDNTPPSLLQAECLLDWITLQTAGSRAP